MDNIYILPKANTSLKMPLMEAIEKRRTIRKWSEKEIEEQTLADLLWVACGVTKEAKGKGKSRRTVPSACNSKEIKVYALTAKGAFLYNEDKHGLIKVCDEDIRAYIGTQKMMKKAPLGLVYVADLDCMKSFILKNDDAKNFMAWVDTGFLSQNVYLYCAAANLATAVLGLVKREELASRLALNENQKIVVTQVVGHMQADKS